MFREMRRSGQQLSDEKINAVMNRCTNGVLACIGDDDYPYAVPLNFVWYNGRVYFHSAKAGHKVDAIIKTPKVSFAIIDEDTIVSAEYTSYFRSVVVFGRARIVTDPESTDAFAVLVDKFSGDQSEEAKKEAVAGCSRSYVIAIDVDHITGKESKELV